MIAQWTNTNSNSSRLFASVVIFIFLLQLTSVGTFADGVTEPGDDTVQRPGASQDLEILEACAERIPHPPIMISGDSSFSIPGNGVVSGEGTQSAPYIIEGWCIVGHGGPVGYGGACTEVFPQEDTCVHFPLVSGIRFLNTTAHVVVRDNVLVPPQRIITDQLIDHDSGIPPSQYGIILRGVQNITLESNLIAHNQWDGIYLFESDYNSIINNTVSTSRTGINLRSSNQNLVEGNLVHNHSSYGIFVFGGYEGGATGPSDHNVLKDNIVRTTLKDGITLYTAQYNIVDGNRVSDAHGHHNTYSECSYERCRKGISLMLNADHNVVSNNLIFENGKGIGITTSSDNIFDGNTIRDSATYGIYTPNGSERNSFTNNTISENFLQGMVISVFADNVVRNNAVTNNGGVGIEFFKYGDEGLILKGNNIHENGWLPYSRSGQLLQSSGITFLNDLADSQVEAIDLAGNWWGDASGPSGVITDACTGDSLSGSGALIRSLDENIHICVSPWLDAPNQVAGHE